jgi:hypothetical protein
MRNANLASPRAGQHREAWSKEPPVTAERRCNPRLIWVISIERRRADLQHALFDRGIPTVDLPLLQWQLLIWSKLDHGL